MMSSVLACSLILISLADPSTEDSSDVIRGFVHSSLSPIANHLPFVRPSVFNGVDWVREN